jgi:hypothetical protein
MITPDLIRKHASRLASVLDEATVKSHQRRSKKGKAFTVQQFERGGVFGMRKIGAIRSSEINKAAKRSGVSASTIRKRLAKHRKSLVRRRRRR